MFRRLRVILNPHSGKRPGLAALGRALGELEDRGWRVDRRTTRGPRDAERLAAEAAAAGYDAVLVCGGDGTINEAVSGLAGSETALAVLPAGTVNIWAREAGISHRPAEAVRLIADGARLRVDLGRVDGRHFLLLASAGSDSVALAAVSTRAKRRWGRYAFLVAGARDLARRGGAELRIESDQRTITGRFVATIVGNTRLYGGVLHATARARADDGLLDLCAYRGKGWRDLLPHIARTVLRRHRDNPDVEYVQATHFRISSAAPLPVQADGEVVAQTPVSIEVAPRALTVIVPRGLHSPLFAASTAGERQQHGTRVGIGIG